MAVHCPRSGGAHGGDHLQITQSLDNYGGGTALRTAMTRQCTALTAAVHIGRTGATSFSAAPRLGLGGHRPRGGGATGHAGGAPLEHHTLGLLYRSPLQGWQCTG